MTSAAARLVGVLGGMGPAATVDFYGKLLQETPAKRDQEHLPVMIWADPRVPDRTEGLMGSGEDPTPWLRKGISALVAVGCDLLAVPCNTAHAYLPALAREAGVQLVNIVEVTADAISTQGVGAVGLLATTGTLRSRLYADALQRRGIVAVEPSAESQTQVMSVIHAVKSGDVGPAQAHILWGICESLSSQGAECMVAACTELLLALDHALGDVPVIDPARVLARSVVEAAFNGTGEPGVT